MCGEQRQSPMRRSSVSCGCSSRRRRPAWQRCTTVIPAYSGVLPGTRIYSNVRSVGERGYVKFPCGAAGHQEMQRAGAKNWEWWSTAAGAGRRRHFTVSYLEAAQLEHERGHRGARPMVAQADLCCCNSRHRCRIEGGHVLCMVAMRAAWAVQRRWPGGDRLHICKHESSVPKP